jgi:DNA polymerase III subunit epsilon
MREIVLDTETTGISPSDGHRMVEIGAVELEGHIPTGRTLQLYINPERPVPPEAVAVHGLDDAFLKDKPVFSACYEQFLQFIGEESQIVAHNAAFDMGFLNYELKSVGHGGIAPGRVTDTLDIARKKFPGSPANLDALCRRFGIDASERDLHGALLDSQLLAEVYLELLGGRQHGFALTVETQETDTNILEIKPKPVRPARAHAASAAERAAHGQMVKALKNALWDKESAYSKS